MKKIILILIIGVIVLFGLQAAASPLNFTDTTIEKWTQISEVSLVRGDILDQSQPEWDSAMSIGVQMINGSPRRSLGAQSFTPSLNILTRVELMLGRVPEASSYYTVSIRENLNESNLTSVSIHASEITSGSLDWEEFDFPDIMVIPGKTYYIVSIPEYVWNNLYGWALKNDDVYPNGMIFYSWYNETLWEGYSTADFTFKTYGVNNIQPINPTIDGPNYGKVKTIYTFSTGEITDPNGDSLHCLFDWGDGNTSGWLGPYNSGQTVNISHAWDEPGTYTIKVKIKDTYGAESNWSEPFIIEIVELKTAFFLGTFNNINETEDLIVLQARSFVIFPSDSIFNKEGTIVISKDYLGYVGASFTIGVGGVTVIL